MELRSAQRLITQQEATLAFQTQELHTLGETANSVGEANGANNLGDDVHVHVAVAVVVVDVDLDLDLDVDVEILIFDDCDDDHDCDCD